MSEPKGERNGDWRGVAGAVLSRPSLWVTATRQARRLSARRWWRRPPFLPVPARSWLRFREETQYGADGRLEPGDVVRWLEWARATDRRNRTLASRVRR